MIIEQYKKEIDKTIKILLSLKNLSFSSINIYGSSINKEIFKKGYSDIDMIVMNKDFEKMNLNLIIDELSRLNVDFKEKRPMIVDDNICKRIEFYLKYPNISIDITISPGLIPSYESLEKNVWYDSFEALMGGVYEKSKSIYGTIPDYDRYKREFFPFYNDDLRTKRLDILANRILITNDLLKTFIYDKNLNLTDYVYKIRKHFIKFMYIYYRKYFLSPEKHTYYQLENILNLPDEEKRIICLAKGDIFNSAKEYIDLSDEYIYRYNNEKKLTRSKK